MKCACGKTQLRFRHWFRSSVNDRSWPHSELCERPLLSSPTDSNGSILSKNSIRAFRAAILGVSNHHLINLHGSERVLEGRLFRRHSTPPLQLSFSTVSVDNGLSLIPQAGRSRERLLTGNDIGRSRPPFAAAHTYPLLQTFEYTPIPSGLDPN